MNICLYANDMYPGTERLMPWRTLVEVAKYMNSLPDINAEIYSAQDQTAETRIYDTVKIRCVRKGIPTLVSLIHELAIDVLYYPIAFRDVFRPLKLLEEGPIRKIAYIPGGIYSWQGIGALCKIAGMANAKAYLLEKLIPHSWMIRKLKTIGFSSVVSLSRTTTRDVIRNGWYVERAYTAIPGIDEFPALEADYSVCRKLDLRHRKFILFSGAPAPIRGSMTLLRAFDRFAERNSDTLLVLLMCKDNSSEFTAFKELVNRLRHKERVVISYERLSPPQLKAFFESAYVVALPFLLVPSEIPLTFFEVLSCGTPVVTFENEGTTDYVKKTIVSSKARDARSLSVNLENVCNNNQYRDYLSERALELMKKHPSWEDSAKIWIKAINGHYVL